MREPSPSTLRQMRQRIAKDRREREEPQFAPTALIPPGAMEFSEGCYRTPPRRS